MSRWQPGHRDVWRLSAPMIASNVSIPLLGMVDTAVVGHLPEPHHLGAVAVGAVVFSFIFWGFGFLRMGTTGFVAQAYGSNEPAAVLVRLTQAALLALLLAVVVLALQLPIRELAFAWIDASEAVDSEARQYFAIRIWAAPATLMTYVLIGGFLGMQDARAPLAMMLTANAVNIVLDLLFVVVWDMGVPGVAWASLIGEYLAVALGLGLAWRRRLFRSGPVPWKEVFDAASMLSVLRVNGDIMLRTLCLIFAFAFFTRQGARQGEVILAANAVLLNLQNFMAFALDGFAHAAEALVGRAVGARDRAAMRQAMRLTALWSLGVSLLFAVAYLLGGRLVVGLMTDIPEVRLAAAAFLPWMIASPLISVWSYWLDGVFIGATRGRDMRNTMLIATAACFLPAWWLLQGWGNHGLWAALMIFLAARGIGLGLLAPRLLRTVT